MNTLQERIQHAADGMKGGVYVSQPTLRQLVLEVAEREEKLNKLVTDWNGSTSELRGDGVYRCCAGTYEHCATYLKVTLEGST